MTRVYLDVPFAEKDAAKRKGAQWDPAARKWYAYSATAAEALLRWVPSPLREDIQRAADERAEASRMACEWHNRPPRSQNAVELMRIAGLSQLRPAKLKDGRCLMCDSTFSGWYTSATSGCEFRHLADDVGRSPLFPSEIDIIERALDQGLLPSA